MTNTDYQNRRLVYTLLITLAVGLTAGRIASVERLHEPSVHKVAGSDVPRPAWPKERPEPSPTFSSNDRSRWAAARALVEKGTFVIGRRIDEGKTYRDEGIVFEDGYGTVDKMLNPDTHEFYSTKPPLLTLLMAAEYWVLKNAFGWTMAVPKEADEIERARVYENRFHVTRVALVTFNLLPFVLYLGVLAWLVERLGVGDWPRYFVVAAGAFATLVSPFLITINNHTPAATAAALLLCALVRIREDREAVGAYLLAGLSAGLLASLELPALALTAVALVYVVWRSPRMTAPFLAAALVPVGISLWANYLQLGEWVPAYSKFNTAWYQYEGSHWLPAGQTKRGIDYARRNGETVPTYAFHLLMGHHGIFSLTPMTLLSLVGMIGGAVRMAKRDNSSLTLLNVVSLLVSVVVVGFYLYKSDNYGGWSNGPRWLMWLSPLWLVAMLPVLEALAESRWGRALALLLLAASILSMGYQNWNPWRHPWLYNWMETRGWVNY